MGRSPVETPIKTATLRQIMGRRIKRMMDLSGVDALELAELLGVHRNTVSNWLLGNTSPSAEHVSIMCHLWDIPVDYLMLTTDSEPIPRKPQKVGDSLV